MPQTDAPQDVVAVETAARAPAPPDQLPVWVAVLASGLVVGSGTATVLAAAPRR